MRREKPSKPAVLTRGFKAPGPHPSKQELNRQLLSACLIGDQILAGDALERGADPDARDRYQRTCLILTAIESFPEIAKMLLDSGADPRAKDKYGMTALKYAELFYHKDMMRLLDGTLAA